jgi:uncharacterized membrane protein YphA (DoxX/SURF4 family)
MSKLITKLNKYGNSFRVFEPNIARVLIGVFILYKGLTFLQHTNILMEVLNPADAGLTEIFIVHYVQIGHIVGGLFLISGLLTRIAAIIQIPILIGAVIVNAQLGDVNQLVISIAVLSFLFFFTIIGSGKYSMDYNLKMEM